MLIQLKKDFRQPQKDRLLRTIQTSGYKTTEVRTQSASYLLCHGRQEVDIRLFGQDPCVDHIYPVDEDYKLVSGAWKTERTALDLGDDICIGNGSFGFMAGPCSIESEAQVIATVEHLQQQGVRIMRGGVFKPRSSPYAFRGNGLEALKMWHTHASPAGIRIISEVMQPGQIAEMYPYVDIFQVGARNSQNFSLLDELGRQDKPVLIKRGISGTIAELLNSAEYVYAAGNEKILLCERGIRTFENASRNTFDINAIVLLKQATHLPVIADPSHGIGIRSGVEAVALAAVAAGADGLLYETHPNPAHAWSDGQQTLDFEESAQLIRKVSALRTVL